VTTTLWSEEAGDADAPLVALVHGSLDRSAGMLKLSRRLDGRFRVLRYDRRGYGRSTPHEGPFDIEAQVADLAAVLDGRRAVVFGHSYGGNVALGLADRHPALVEAVGVFETPLSWLEWWPTDSAGGRAARTDGDPAEAAEHFMRRMVGDDKWQRLPARTRAARRTEGVTMVAELADLHRRAPWDADRITVPAVAMRGSAGHEHHRRSTEHLGAVLADCAVVTIEGARHFGPSTHPDAVAAALTDLVSRAASRR
jgi:pimeloyl-ACP methyl ester carboxylesterase